MGYYLGVDIGTTFTAAAVCRDGAAEPFRLGNRADEIPSTVYIGSDGEVLVGDAAAARRGFVDAGLVVSEFKRRVGDEVDILVGAQEYPAHALMAKLLTNVLEAVTSVQEEQPAGITLTHPASWGSHRLSLLDEVAQMAGATGVQFVSEPTCAAVTYAAEERVHVGEVIAVYDFGGGTFDAAVLRKSADGFTLLGEPLGRDRLGGVDFDDKIFQHVMTSLGLDQQPLTPDPAVGAALRRLRRDCTEAKELLSYDTVAEIAVTLPGLHTTVRINRSEFEDMIRKDVSDTIIVLSRTLRSADVRPDQLRSVLLAGGSSRIPLVKLLVSAEFDCPVVLDSRPEHSVALGAALLARAKDQFPDTGRLSVGASAVPELSPLSAPDAMASERLIFEESDDLPPAASLSRSHTPTSRRRGPLFTSSVAAAAVLVITGGILGGRAIVEDGSPPVQVLAQSSVLAGSQTPDSSSAVHSHSQLQTVSHAGPPLTTATSSTSIVSTTASETPEPSPTHIAPSSFDSNTVKWLRAFCSGTDRVNQVLAKFTPRLDFDSAALAHQFFVGAFHMLSEDSAATAAEIDAFAPSPIAGGRINSQSIRTSWHQIASIYAEGEQTMMEPLLKTGDDFRRAERAIVEQATQASSAFHLSGLSPAELTFVTSLRGCE